MAAAQLLKLAHGIDDKVTRIDDEVKGVGGQVNDIGDTVRVVHNGGRKKSLGFILCELDWRDERAWVRSIRIN